MTTEAEFVKKEEALNKILKEREEKITALEAQVKELQKTIDLLRKGGCDAVEGDTVEVVGLESWKGWTGKLIKADVDKNRAAIECTRKRTGEKETYYTALNRVRKYVPKAS